MFWLCPTTQYSCQQLWMILAFCLIVSAPWPTMWLHSADPVSFSYVSWGWLNCLWHRKQQGHLLMPYHQLTGVSGQLLHRLQMIQNAAARVVTGATSTVWVKKSSPPKLFAIFSFRINIFTWNFANLLPVYIHTCLPVLNSGYIWNKTETKQFCFSFISDVLHAK